MIRWVHISMRNRLILGLVVTVLACLLGWLVFSREIYEPLVHLFIKPHPYEDYSPVRFPRCEIIYGLYTLFLVVWLISCLLWIRSSRLHRKLPMRMERGWRWLNLLFFILSLAIFLLHARNQPGLSPVAMGYIGSAENLAAGLGYTTFRVSLETREIPQPLTTWPPLFSALIAAGIKVGLDPILAARGLNLLATALALFPMVWLGEALIGRRAAILAAVAFPVFIPFVKLSAYAWSEGMFILWILLACLALAAIRPKNSPCEDPVTALPLILAAGLACGLATLTRYIGIFLIPAGNLYLILRAHAESSWRAASKRRLVLDLFCFNAGWIALAFPFFLRNLLKEGHLLGAPREASTMGFFFLLRWTWTTLLTDIIPLPFPFPTVIRNILLILVTGTIVVLCALWASRRWENRGSVHKRDGMAFHLRSALKGMERSSFLLLWLIPGMYLIILLAVRSLIHLDGITYRFLSPIYPFFLLGAGWAVARIGDHRTFSGVSAFWVFFFILLLLPHAIFYQWIESRHGIGQFTESARVHWVREHTEPRDFIFSDMGEEVMLFAHRVVYAVEPFPYKRILSHERILRFKSRWQQKFRKFYLVISPDVLWIERRYPILKYGRLIHDLYQGRTTGYPGFELMKEAPPRLKIYEIN